MARSSWLKTTISGIARAAPAKMRGQLSDTMQLIETFRGPQNQMKADERAAARRTRIVEIVFPELWSKLLSSGANGKSPDAMQLGDAYHTT